MLIIYLYQKSSTAQLICPVGYEDPSHAWNLLEKDLANRFPLEKLVWKHPVSQVDIKIDSLPLRCMPMSANLFKDTDHPFRWFLAPYVDIYILVCEGMDVYKSNKPKLKSWVDAQNAIRRTSWIIVYLPMGSQQPDTYQKIYSKLCNDFHADKPGDRSLMLVLSGFRNPSSSHNNSLHSNSSSFSDLILKIRECLIASFQTRLLQYETEIHRLEAIKTISIADFKQIFLVKESLAIMYQMMQLPSEALQAYETLELLLQQIPIDLLPKSFWPLTTGDIITSKTKLKSNNGSNNSNESNSKESVLSPSSSEHEHNKLHSNNTTTSTTPANITTTTSNNIDHWNDALTHGEGLLAYSINNARMKVLKNKIGLYELQRYIFARRCYFLLWINKATVCVELGISYIMSARSILQERLDELRKNSTLASLTSISTSSSIGSVVSESRLNATTDSVTDQLRSILTTTDIHRAVDIWAISAAVSLTKISRKITFSYTLSPTNNDNDNNTNECGINICNLLSFAMSKLQNILLSKTCSLEYSRKLIIVIILKMNDWSSFQMIRDEYSNIFQIKQSLVDSTHVDYENDVEDNNDGKNIQSDKAIENFGEMLRKVLEAQKKEDKERVETNVLVALIQCLADHELSIGRRRSNWSWQLQCADILICNGQFKRALTILQKALMSTLIMSKTVVKSMKRSAIQSLQRGISTDVDKGRESTDTITSSNISSSGDKEESFKRKRLDVPMRPLIEASIQIMNMKEVVSNIQLSHSCQIIRDETIQTTNLQCEGGKTGKDILLRIKSNLPNTITIQAEDIQVLYAPVENIILSLNNNNNSTDEYDNITSVALLSAESHGFTCTPILDYNTNNNNDNNNDSSTSIDLIPGVCTDIPLKFESKYIGEFVSVAIYIHIQGLQFIDVITAESTDYHRFLHDHTIISINKPSIPLKMTLQCPPYTPIAQEDFLRIQIGCIDSNDHLSDIIMSMEGIEIHDENNSHMSTGSTSTINDINTSIIMNSKYKQADCNNLQRPLVSAVGLSSINEGSDSRSITFGTPSQWILSSNKINTSIDDNKLKIEQLNTDHDNIMNINIDIPFIIDNNNKKTSIMTTFCISCTISGVIRTGYPLQTICKQSTIIGQEMSSSYGEEYCTAVILSKSLSSSSSSVIRSNIQEQDLINNNNNICFDMFRSCIFSLNFNMTGECSNIPMDTPNRNTITTSNATTNNDDKNNPNITEVLNKCQFQLNCAVIFSPKIHKKMSLSSIIEAEVTAILSQSHAINRTGSHTTIDNIIDTEDTFITMKSLTVGTCIRCVFILNIRSIRANWLNTSQLFRNKTDRTSNGVNGDNGSNNDNDLILSITVRESKLWAVVGNLKKIIRFTGKQSEFTLETQLVALECGVHTLPPLMINCISISDTSSSSSSCMMVYPHTNVHIKSIGRVITTAYIPDM
eukprot:gene808-1576_t